VTAKVAMITPAVRERKKMISELIGLDGRIGRFGYFGRIILVQVMGTVLFLLPISGPIEIMLEINVNIAALVIGYCATMRRLHDFGWGRAKILLLLVPLFNLIVLLMLLFRPGDSDENKHGYQPEVLGVG
jgi:uncharacterized membrane protein YhaH (DUF805 family)